MFFLWPIPTGPLIFIEIINIQCYNAIDFIRTAAVIFCPKQVFIPGWTPAIRTAVS